VFGLGVLMALSPCVAHAYGANDAVSVTRFLRQSLWLSLVLSIIVMVALWQSPFVFALFAIDPEILPIAVGYTHAISFGMPALFVFVALRFTSEGLGITRPIMYIAFLGLAANVLGNWLFIYGHLGFPQLGATGCAVATAISLWLMLVAMMCCMHWQAAYRTYRFFHRIDAPNYSVLMQLMRLGVPIGLGITAEGSLFVVAALFMGAMGATVTAAHQIAINYAALMFMIPLAMTSATTIHVGHALGRGNVSAARTAGWVGIAMCGIVMTVSALLIVLFRHQIAAMYTSDSDVLTLATTLLLMAAIFQVSDGLQVGAVGALRGFKDTSWPLGITLTSYTLIGFPIAYILGVREARGPIYVWLGFILGLSVAALLLNLRYRIMSNRAVAMTIANT
jgi:multidrug resistance protein, MATE family